jgi:hypothetical protein
MMTCRGIARNGAEKILLSLLTGVTIGVDDTMPVVLLQTGSVEIGCPLAHPHSIPSQGVVIFWIKAAGKDECKMVGISITVQIALQGNCIMVVDGAFMLAVVGMGVVDVSVIGFGAGVQRVEHEEI